MKPTQAVNLVTATMIKATLPEFGVGDTVRVSVKVVEGTRERTQVFEGVVMRKRGGGINTNFTVRRIAAHGIGVERTFLLHSPRVEKIEVVRHGMVRRAQLYFLRGRTGKAARIKERRYRPGAETSKTRSVATLEVPVAADMEAPDDTDDEMLDDAEMMAADDIEGVTSEADDVAEDDTESVSADDTEAETTEAETTEVSAEENGDTPNKA